MNEIARCRHGGCKLLFGIHTNVYQDCFAGFNQLYLKGFAISSIPAALPKLHWSALRWTVMM